MYTSDKKHIKKISSLIIIIMLSSSFLQLTNSVVADSLPDLIPTDEYTIIPSTIVRGDTVEIKINIKNIGDEDIPTSQGFDVSLFIDEHTSTSSPVSTTTINGLSSDAKKNVTLDWTAEIGNHVLIIYVDHYDSINEKSEDNNGKEIPVTVTKRPTDIHITNFGIIDDPQFGETSEVYVNVTNIGESTTNKITSKLRIIKEGATQTTQQTHTYGLRKDGWFNFTFEWDITHFGTYTLNTSILYNNKADYSDIFDIIIGPVKIEWWNTSWHYRQLIEVQESGVISKEHNFTKYLNELNLFDKTFENDTIRIIEYNDSGKVVNVVEEYNFDESDVFDNRTDANGTILWNVTGEFTGSRYFYIYFDVKENMDDRTILNETDSLNASGNTSKTFSVEGWWLKIIEPSYESYQSNSDIDIKVETTAQASSVWFKKFIEDVYFASFVLPDNENNTIWSTDDFPLDIEGNWKFEFNSSDAAGYEPEPVIYTFYVGDPDLTVGDITYSPSTVYEGDSVRIKADIRAYNATVPVASISLFIDDEYFDETNQTILIDRQNIFTFNWTAPSSGEFTIKIVVDKDDDIVELEEDNNENETTITVIGLPDIHIDNVTVPSEPVEEGGVAEIIALVNNSGHEDAVDYELELYVEEGDMDWDLERSTKTFSVKQDEVKEVKLTWSPAEKGNDWTAGVKLSSEKRNLNTGVTKRTSPIKFEVEPAEKVKPSITNITFTNTQDQGKPVVITADITDESGIEHAIINITNPNNVSIEEDMTEGYANEYSFTYTETQIVGEYIFYIKATDGSYNHNAAESSDHSFTITEDETPPSITYVGAHPDVQTKEDEIKLVCIASDYMGIESVEVVITYPYGGQTITRDMEKSSDGKYVYSEIFELSGKYQFYVKAYDTTNLTIDTKDDKKSFWITSNIEDTDDDGIPDWWEEKYGFNKFDPNDADLDWDDDGYTNYQEYKSNTNPLEAVVLENMFSMLKDNSGYLFLSIGLFIIIFILFFIGIIRRKRL